MRLAWQTMVCGMLLFLLGTWAAAAERRHHAFLVGVETYATKPLKYCCDDVLGVAEQLNRLRFDRVQVLVDQAPRSSPFLLPGRPTRQEILDQLDRFLADVAAEDLIVFMFSGHGCTGKQEAAYGEQASHDSYLQPVDWNGDFGSGISLKSLIELMQRRARYTEKVLILDACRYDNAGFAVSRVGQEIPEEMFILCGCRSDQMSHEEDTLEHGIFSHFLIEGLQTRAGRPGEPLTATKLFEYAEGRTKQAARDKFKRDQNPYMRANAPGFLLTKAGRERGFKGDNLTYNSDFRDLIIKARKVDRIIRDVDFTDSRLSGMQLKRLKFVNCRFKNTDLSDANLDGADFSFTVFEGGSLRKASIEGTRFRGVQFKGTDLRDLKFEDASDLSGIEVDWRCQTDGATGLPKN